MDEKQPIDGRSPTKRLEPITARWPPTPLITYTLSESARAA